MAGGTLFISKAYNLFSHEKQKLEKAGFVDVQVTGEEKDSLNMLINETKPRFVLIDALFFQYSTPFMMGELLRKFPRLNIAAIAFHQYPVKLAMSFLLYGVKSYVDKWDGIEEFRLGLDKIRAGETYISPKVKEYMENNHDEIKQKTHITGMEMEVLRNVCGGLSATEVGNVLHISRRTVETHKRNLRKIWSLQNERELICTAFSLGLVTKDDVYPYGRDRKKCKKDIQANSKGKSSTSQLKQGRQLEGY